MKMVFKVTFSSLNVYIVTFYVHVWPFVTFYDWFDMAFLWCFMAFGGHLWPFMVIYGKILSFLAVIDPNYGVQFA